VASFIVGLVETGGHIDDHANQPDPHRRFLNDDVTPAEATHTLLSRAVAAIAKAQEQNIRSARLLSQAQDRLNWAERLLGEASIIDSLRDAVGALARSERMKGEPPERVILLLKRLTVQAGGEQLEAPDGRMLVEDVVRWGIDAYYAA